MEDIDQKRQTLKTAMQQSFDAAKYKEFTSMNEFDGFIREQQELLDACQRRRRPCPDLFGIERHSCSVCTTLCEIYEPFEVFMLEMHERSYADSFVPTLCRNCKCPAYFHFPIQKQVQFPEELKEGLRNFTLKEDNLNFQGIVVIFDIIYNEIDGEILTVKSQEDSLFLLLQYGGFRVIARAVKVLNNNSSKNLMNLAKREIGSIQLRESNARLFQERENTSSLALCLSATAYMNSQVHFFKYIRAAGHLVPKGFRFVYSSANAVQGLTDCTVFFPEVFSLKKMCVLLMPESDKLGNEPDDPMLSFFKKQRDLMRGVRVVEKHKDPNDLSFGRAHDLLNYNGYSVQSSIKKSVQSQNELIRVFDRVIDEERSVSFIRLLLGNSEHYKVQALAAAKAGMPMLLTTNPFSIDTFAFNSTKDCHELFKFFLPELATDNKTVIIFRPLAVRSGLDRILLEIFKCNFFVILYQIRRKITMEEAELLVRGTEFSQRGKQEYFDFMQENECRIVVLSKFGGVHDAKVLCDGCQYGRRRTEKRLLGASNLTIKHEREIYNPFHAKYEAECGLERHVEKRHIKEEVVCYNNIGENSLFTLNPFSSVAELFDIDAIIENRIKLSERPEDNPNLHKRQRELEKYREFSKAFNIAIHCSNDSESAEREIAHFAPHLLEFSDVIFIYKEEAYSLRREIASLLETLQAKTITSFKDGDTEYLHIAKQAARIEFASAMIHSALVTPPLSLQHLSSIFSLIDVPAEHQRILEYINLDISNFTGESVLNTNDSVRNSVLRYILLVNHCEEIIPDRSHCIYSSNKYNHVSFFVLTEANFSREIRIRRREPAENAEINEERLSYFDQYSRTKWFYQQISHYYPDIVPSMYSFKVEPDDNDLGISRVFTSEEFKGDIFIEVVAQLMKEHRYREKSRSVLSSDANRGSLVAFLWGKKLANLILKLENVHSDIEDCGVIYRTPEGPMKGSVPDHSFWEFETYKYMKCLDELKSTWSEYISTEQAESIEKRLVEAVQSPAFKEIRSLANVRLVPEYIDFINIRIFSKQEEAGNLVKDVRFIDERTIALAELQGKHTQIVDLKELAIVDVLPLKTHKRHPAANTVWLLQFYLLKIHKKNGKLSMTPEEYTVLISSIYEGFIKNYNNDAGVKEISCLKLEVFMFSLWKTWNLHIAIIDLKERISRLIYSRDHVSHIAQGTYKDIYKQANSQVKSLQKELVKWERDYKEYLLFLYTLDIEYIPPEGKFPGRVFIDKNRYFKHFGMEKFEPDLNNPKYPNLTIQRKFPIVSTGEFTVLGRPLSEVQKKWFNPAYIPRTNLRPVPDSAYKKAGITAKATRWVTHERLQLLITEAIKTLLTHR